MNSNTQSIRVSGQTPLDAKLIFQNENDLLNHILINPLYAFDFYKGMRVYLQEESKLFIWEYAMSDFVKNRTKLLPANFVYPQNANYDNLDYSNKAYNLFQVEDLKYDIGKWSGVPENNQITITIDQNSILDPFKKEQILSTFPTAEKIVFLSGNISGISFQGQPVNFLTLYSLNEWDDFLFLSEDPDIEIQESIIRIIRAGEVFDEENIVEKFNGNSFKNAQIIQNEIEANKSHSIYFKKLGNSFDVIVVDALGEKRRISEMVENVANLDAINAAIETVLESIENAKIGISGTATQLNSPTPYVGPEDLYESYIVRSPLVLPNNWGFAVTQEELDENFVYFDVKNGVVSKEFSFKNNEVADGSISAKKTDFAEKTLSFGKNRFDKSTIIDDKYVNPGTGALDSNASYSASDFIYVGDLQGEEINITYMFHLAFYTIKDVSGYISGKDGGTSNTEVPANANYVRFSIIDSTNINTIMLERGSVPTTYESYILPVSEVTINGLLIENKNIKKESVSIDKTDFAEEVLVFGKNRFDKTTITSDYYVNATTGSLSPNSAYVASAFIYIKDCTEIIMSSLIHIAFYDNSFVFISGREFGGDSISVPLNAIYCRVSIYKDASVNSFQLEKGTVKTDYTSYVAPVNKINIPNLLLENQDQNTENHIFFGNPAIVYLVENRPADFIFESFLIPKIGKKLNQYYTSSVGYRGSFFSDRLRIVPVDDSNFLFKVEQFPQISEQKHIAIKCAPLTNGSGTTVKIIYLGDSTVNNGHLIKEINDYFAIDSMNVNFVGTRSTGGISHEGRSGWTFANYFTAATIGGVANPFYNGTTFSFSNYLTTTGITLGANDWFFIQLGINDLYSISGSLLGGDVESQITSMTNFLSQMIIQIHAHNPGIKIGVIMTTPPAISQDATANLLSSSIYSSEYYLKKGIVKWWEVLLEQYDNLASRNNKIYLIPCNMTIDRVNGYSTASVNTSPFNPNQIIQQIDDVHLTANGYKEQATPVIGAIKTHI